MGRQTTIVLMVGPLPPPYSGPEISMKLFMESGLKERFELHFVKTNLRKDNVNKGKLDISGFLSIIRFYLCLLWQLIIHRPKLVYYPVTPTASGWLFRDAPTLLLCRLLRIRSVIHLRGSHFMLNYQTFSRCVQRIIRKAISKVSLAIVQADYLHEEFATFLPPERIKTLYQAINISEFPVNREISEKGKVLFMGHLTHAKGYCDTLRAMELVLEKCPNAQFYFAGNMRKGERGVFFDQASGKKLTYEDPFECTKQLLATNAGKHYHNLGIITGEDKLRHLQSCEVFLSPSYSEGFSRSLLEAMTVGKALVYTPVGAHREVLHDGVNGIKILPGDVEALADSIVQLLTDAPLRKSMEATNSQYARNSFENEVISQQLGNMFEETIACPL